ncbi:MAG: endoglucanase [Gammaproteobacteria bacterium]|jgi:aryl-phospho-beta-D-glucosidase BglC (GH1 family)|nr:endoglucanase [Gammaproteobacteria bacterium]
MRRSILLLSSLLMLTGLYSNTASAQMSMLHAQGRSIVNAQGQVVPLQGVNLGGWFVMEKWMTPLDSGSLSDTYTVMQKLDQRFGVETEQSLIKTFQQSWITTTDLDNIKNAGFNVVRAPIWWGQFYLLNDQSPGGWRADAFDTLDWLVSACAARGIYVIIDMHGVVGGQSTSDDTGRSGQNQYWTNNNFQGDTAYMWWQIANHFKGNPTVAGYDLINEPIGTPSSDTLLNLYNELYQSIRSVDPAHMIIIEGTWGNWNWSMLPNPNVFGWTNVAYQMHEYQWNASQAQVQAGATNQVNDFNNHASYNVPGYVGEFNDFGYPASTWQFTTNAWNAAGLSWTVWSYKATQGLIPNSWGLYDPNHWATTPNISTDSAATIAADWQQWTTPATFSLNTALGLHGNQNGGSTTINTSAWYNVVNTNSGACVDAANQATANGTAIQQWACGPQQVNQEWQLQSQGNGNYSIVARGAPGQALDVINRGTANGSLIQLWTYGGGTNQQWMPVSVASGLYKLVNVASGRCLDVPAASTANGVQLEIYDCNGTGAQSFRLSPQP